MTPKAGVPPGGIWPATPSPAAQTGSQNISHNISGVGARVVALDILGAVLDRRVPLEMCPTSNVHTGVCESIAEHPIGLLASLRFRVTVNTDNRLMSGVTLSSEMAALVGEQMVERLREPLRAIEAGRGHR